jgi:hypothetical protein
MKKNIIIALVLILIGVVGFLIYKYNFSKENAFYGCTEEANLCSDGSAVGRSGPKCEFAECPPLISILTEVEARVIAERSCIKGGEALMFGTYNQNSKTWWFDANLNATREGCSPACVVDEALKTAEINWRCTGLIVPQGATGDIQKLFVDKYPKYAATLTIRVDQETDSHARGGVIFEADAPGGIFLATKIDGKWQIVFDGNGQIPCSLSKYGFPVNMLSDCVQ